MYRFQRDLIVPSGIDCDIICLDDLSVVKALDNLPHSGILARVRSELDSDQLCYIIYTSGTSFCFI